MNIAISKQQGSVPVTIMHLEGNLDASNYIEVIAKAREIYESGARDLLIDLGKVIYMSSAGLMAMHTVVLIFSGAPMQDNSSGRPAFRSIDPSRDNEVRKHVKLFNPQPAIETVLDVVGLKDFFEIHKDLNEAVKSFQSKG